MSVQQTRLTGVQETLLYTLYFRALDARSAAPIVGDPWANDVLGKIEHRSFKLKTRASDRFVFLLRAWIIDTWAREFLAQYPDAVVIYLGCGLDSRAFRIDVPDGVDWFDIDFPEVIELRRQLYPDRANHHLIGSSVTDPAWLDEIPRDRPVLVLAEGLLMYLAESDAHALLTRLTSTFDHGELQFDVLAPWLAKVSKLFRWGMRDPHEIEQRHPRTKLVDELSIESELHRVPNAAYRGVYRLMYRIPRLRTMTRVLRYRFD